MTYLNELKPDDLARIVKIDSLSGLNERFDVNGLSEGCIIKIVTRLNTIVFSSNGKTFVISKNLAGKIRVIPLIYVIRE